MWTFDEAMEAVTALQPELREIGYHMALGGGVLNSGTSEKDLDLYFLPLGGLEGKGAESGSVAALLESYFGGFDVIGEQDYDAFPGGTSPYALKLKFVFDNRRIDAFIL